MTYAVPYPLKKYPFIKLLVPLTAGIILQWYLQLPISLILFSTGFIILALTVFFFFSVAKKFSLRWLQGSFILLLFAMLGSIITYTKDIRHQKEWMGNYYKPGATILVTLEEPLVEKNNSYKAIATVNAVKQNNNWINTKGEILVY